MDVLHQDQDQDYGLAGGDRPEQAGSTQWITQLDPSSQHYYYYNTTTRLSQWDVPEDIPIPIPIPLDTPTPTPTPIPLSSSQDWIQYRDPLSQEVFYHDTVTSTSQWERPSCYSISTNSTNCTNTNREEVWDYDYDSVVEVDYGELEEEEEELSVGEEIDWEEEEEEEDEEDYGSAGECKSNTKKKSEIKTKTKTENENENETKEMEKLQISEITQISEKMEKTQISQTAHLSKPSKALLIARELVQTEHTYVSNLSVLVKAFISPLEANPSLSERLDPSISLLFSTLHQIHTLNSNFERQLEALLVPFEGGGIHQREEEKLLYRIGSLFLQQAPLLEVYTRYSDHYDLSISVLEKQRNSDISLNEFFRGKEALSLARGQRLGSFLIMPVQRIPRYILLLEELLGNAKGEALELTKAVEEISEIAFFCNEKIKIRKNREKLFEIESKLERGAAEAESSGVVCRRSLEGERGREFVWEGRLKVLVVGEREELREEKVYLFSDLLIFGREESFSEFANGTEFGTKSKMQKSQKIQKSKFILKREFQMEKFVLSFADGKSGLVSEFSESERNSCLLLKSAKESFLVVADTRKEIEEVHGYLTMCISQSKKEQRSREMMQRKRRSTFSKSPVLSQSDKCKVCQLKLGGALFRKKRKRHHCMKCGGAVCAKCSQFSAIVERISSKIAVKVCDICKNEKSGISGISKIPKKTVPLPLQKISRRGSLSLQRIEREMVDSSKGSNSVSISMKEIIERSFSNSKETKNRKKSKTFKNAKNAKSQKSQKSQKLSVLPFRERFQLFDKRENNRLLPLSSLEDVFHDFLLSETLYHNQLENCRNTYISPLLDYLVSEPSRALLLEKVQKLTLGGKVAALIGSFERICTISKVFLRKLRKIGKSGIGKTKNGKFRNSEKSERELKSLFLEFLPLFDIYYQYALYFYPAKQVLEDTGIELNFLLKECEQENNQSLLHLLSLPFDRIRAYFLYISKFAEISEKREKLQNFEKLKNWQLSSFESLFKSVKVVLFQFEKLNELSSLEVLFTKSPDINTRGRSLVYCGVLTKYYRRGISKPPQKLYFHLFNDLIMYSRQTRKGLELRNRFGLGECRLTSLNNVRGFDLEGIRRENGNVFGLRLGVGGKGKELVLGCESREEMVEWIEKLNVCMYGTMKVSGLVPSSCSFVEEKEEEKE